MALTKVDDRGLNTPIDLLDNEKIRLGTSNDLEIYHDTTYNILDSKDKGFRVKHDSDLAIETFDDGSVVLYNDSAVRLQTQGTGILYQGDLNGILHVYRTGEGTVRGRIKFDSSDVFHVQDGQSHSLIKATKDGACELYYDGHAAFRTENVGAVLTDNSTSVTLRFETTQGQAGNITGIDNDNLIIQDNLGKDWLNMHKDGQVEIYHNGTKKFETTAAGATLSGELSATGANFTDDGQSSPIVQILADDGSPWGLQIGNSTFGDSLGLHTYCNNTGHVYIDNVGTGSTYPNLDMRLSHGSAAHSMLQLVGGSNTSVKLYSGGVEKFATEADGVIVTDANSSVHIKMNSSDGTAGYVYGSSNNQMGFLDNQGHWLMRGTKDGEAELMYDNTTRFKTLTDGTYVIGRAQVQCEGDSVCQLNSTTHSSGAYHQENLGNSGGVIAYVGHSSHLCNGATAGNYAIRFEGNGLEFAKSSTIQARITQHGGIAFGGDTAAVNTLGDYEEGQWTPTINYGVVTSGSNALTYSVQQGWYVKIGAFVQASFYIAFGAQGDGNDFTMGGLPFTSVNKPYNNLSYSSSGSLGYKDCNFTNNADQKLYIGNNAANIYFYNNNSGVHSPASTKYVSTSNVSSALYGSVSYRAN